MEFVYGLFNDAVSNSDYISLNVMYVKEMSFASKAFSLSA
jgi:hypothetical protein